MAEPPNYGPQPARFGPRCGICKFYDADTMECTKYAISTKVFMTCDDWERDPDIPIKVV